jgi:hypothetical protein
MLEGTLVLEHYATKEIKDWLARRRAIGTAEFEDETAVEMRRCGLEARCRVTMRSLGAPEELGEVDVLAWSPRKHKVFVVECKDLLFAKTEAEIAEQLNRFKGEAQDDLHRHLRRMEWFGQHPEVLASATGLPISRMTVADVMVTSRPVPFQFTQELRKKGTNITHIGTLSNSLKRWRIV